MGLCKCPKRKVTNLFCFEHRVNVCESCLVSNHESCVVQTYLSWLTDSDYDSNCVLCAKALSSNETIRLKCFHVFHWSCLNLRASKLPNTTAPAGYKCPSCLDVLFPSSNQTSPVIDQLREKLSTVQWASAGLNFDGYYSHNHQTNDVNVSGRWSPAVVLTIPENNSVAMSNSGKMSAVNMENHANIAFEADTFTARSKLLGLDSKNYDNVGVKKISSSTGEDTGGRHEERNDSPNTKYAKKTLERNLRFYCSRLPRGLTRILVLIVTFFIIYYFFFLSSSSLSLTNGNNVDEDPMFDPHANPNIHIE